MNTPHKATPAHWAAVEEYAQQVSSTDACILELRAKVEALERRCEVQLMQLSDLQERHHRLTLQVGHLEYELVRDDDDEPQQHCLEAMDPPETNFKPTPKDLQIRTSLLERVQAAIYDVDYPNGTDEARAAIREVNAWLRERAGGTRASWLLDNEVEQ
jgi:hypothetical protein